MNKILKVIIWKEVKANDWQEVTNFEHQGSVNAIAWAPWECGLKLAACSADGAISLISRKSIHYIYFNKHSFR